MKDKRNIFLFMIIFITLIAMCFGMEYYTTKVDELENSIILLKEEVQIQRDVFSSYLNGTLSKDVGGDY